MKSFIEWLEQDNRRTRKVMAVYLFIIWTITGLGSYILLWLGVDSIAFFSVITGLVATTVAFYMSTKAQND